MSRPARVHRLHVVEREAAQPLHHQHASRHPDTDAGAARPSCVARSPRTRAARSSMFSASSRKSSSSTICSANSSTSAGGLASAAIGMRPMSNGPSHDSARRSARTSAATLRSLHLHHDLFAGEEAGGVHLRDRRRRERLLGELGEHRLERPAEVGFHHGPDVGEPLRRHLVAQLLELVDELVGEQALEGRDDLARASRRWSRAPSNWRRNRREMPARDRGVPRSRTYHGTTASAIAVRRPERSA